MRRLFKNTALRLFAVVMAALVAGALLSLALRGGSSPITSAVSVVVSPLQGLCARAANGLQDFFSYFRSSAVLRAEIDRQAKEIEEIRARIVEFDSANQKLALYEEFLELKREKPSYQFAEASVIGKDAAGQFRTFTLNRGSSSGIQVNNPVLYGKYLVGLVTKVELTSCTVRTILHPEVNVSVYETLTGEGRVSNTTVELSQEGLCQVAELDRSTAVATGGYICTSGVGEIYPRDLIVGTVLEVIDDSQSLTATAIVLPAADFDALRDVFVLTSFS
ncbi:MAG: rod shape-determining protein MreC [Oscillospiraceae bacterium]|nr:rod shape-determining protein MreC [Oscillospiraceae bacterium]